MQKMPMPGMGHDMRKGKGWGHHKGMGGGVLHGEFVTVKPGGGYQPMQMQRGTVTAVSATAITVRSEDGFVRSYVVSKDTLVNAASGGIASVAVNDVVHVRASGAGDKATATDVMDQTKMMANHEKFGVNREKQAADATPSNS